MNLTGKVALVTGASQGLGAVIARTLARHGARVALNFAHSVSKAEAVQAQILAEGGTVALFQADITDSNTVKDLIRAIENRWGGVDILVNNATGPQPMKPIEEQTWQDHLDQLHFFVKAPLELLQETVAGMKANRWGRVINIGSEVVELGNAEFGHYIAAKGAMLGLTRSWATELGRHGITVNLVAPGWIPVERHQAVDPSELAAYSAAVPLGHQGRPEELAETVAFLASDEAGFIHGQKIAVNGGNTYL